MSRRDRMLEILAAANAAPQQVQLEAARGARNNAAWGQLGKLVPTLAGVAGNLFGELSRADQQKALIELKKQGLDQVAVRDATKATADTAARARDDAKDLRSIEQQNRSYEQQDRSYNLQREKADNDKLKVDRETAVGGVRAALGAGLSKSDLETRAKAVGLEPAQLLMQADEANVEEQRKADKANKPASTGTGAGEEKGLRLRKLKLEVAKLENEESGGPGSSVDKANATREEKKQQQVREVENFTSNIDRNIELVISQIDKTGTFELTGPDGAVMDRRLTEIATDLAKLADPGSVAREKEVEMQRKALVDSGFRGLLTRNKTAQQVLDFLKDDVESRRAAAYVSRGLDAPSPRPKKGARAAPANVPSYAEEE